MTVRRTVVGKNMATSAVYSWKKESYIKSCFFLEAVRLVPVNSTKTCRGVQRNFQANGPQKELASN
eukprot:1153391-Pelagomonas_calceolata.AAC.13